MNGRIIRCGDPLLSQRQIGGGRGHRPGGDLHRLGLRRGAGYRGANIRRRRPRDLAEGVPCGTAHNSPLYQNPAFRNIKKSLLHRSAVNYSTMRCPQAERIYATEVVALSEDMLLRKADVDKVLEGIVKLRQNVDELSALS